MTAIAEPHGHTYKQTKKQLKNLSGAVYWINKSKFTFSLNEVNEARAAFGHEFQVSLSVHLL